MEETVEKKKRGAQKGNQNARKHGFYSSALTKEQLREVEDARAVEGLDEEIALFRVKFKALVECDPENIELISLALLRLERLLRAKHAVSGSDKKAIGERVAAILKDIVLPLGVLGITIKKP
jgi:hypothetical protein